VSHVRTPPATLDAFLAGVERRAFARARRATGDRDEALDLVQDAMIQLARHYAARPADEWPALFQRILTNRIRDWQRHQSLRRRLFFWRTPATDNPGEPDDLLDRIPDRNQPDGAGELLRNEVLERLVATVAALPSRQREAFELRIWEGLDVAATAMAMGCSEGSVKTHLSRAMTVLRAAMEGDGT
jgi:RNA polymerase sigma-70 factor (ECF subfamily)